LVRKKPSSLDYETLLHEIALRNWRRSLLSGDLPRALANAGKLAGSKDRFWKWQGQLDAATTHLAAGESSRALDALESAKKVFSGVEALRAPAFEVQAHVLVETGRPDEAAALEGPETTPFRFHRAIACVRLSRIGEATDIADEMASGSLYSIVIRAEALRARERPLEAIESLRQGLSEGSQLPSGPRIPALDTLGNALIDAGELEAASAAFEDIEALPDGLLHWPLLAVRSYYRRGEIRLELGDHHGAMGPFRTFLRFWARGELDRERVDRAAQFVIA
jgi:tetratricopeptide (TPR) repeat protein